MDARGGCGSEEDEVEEQGEGEELIEEDEEGEGDEGD